jgi:dihydroneopterin triphosphate diphosphatase
LNENSFIFFAIKERIVLAKIVNQIVEVCVFRTLKAETHFLVLQRAQEEKLYPGLWQIMTGTMKKNESAFKAALRELKEETGLRPQRCWTIPYVDTYYDLAKDRIQLVPVFAVELDSSSPLRLSSEHQRFEWLRFEEARERLVWPGQKRSMDVVHEFIVGNKETAQLVEITPLSNERTSS